LVKTYVRSAGKKENSKEQVLEVFSTHIVGLYDQQDEEDKDEGSKGLSCAIKGQLSERFIVLVEEGNCIKDPIS